MGGLKASLLQNCEMEKEMRIELIDEHVNHHLNVSGPGSTINLSDCDSVYDAAADEQLEGVSGMPTGMATRIMYDDAASLDSHDNSDSESDSLTIGDVGQS